VATDDGGAVGGLENSGKHAQGGGFAGPIGAQKAVDLARLAGERDVVHGTDLAALLVMKDLGEATRFDHEAVLSL